MERKKIIIKTTKKVFLGVIAFSFLMQLIYLLITLFVPSVSYSYTFPLGNILTDIAMVLNFYLMAITISNAMDIEDEQLRQRKIRMSHTLRTLMIIAFLAVGVTVPVFDVVSVLVPVVFPQLTFFVLKLFKLDKEEEEGENV